MEENKKCPKCGGEMEKGNFQQGYWVSGEEKPWGIALGKFNYLGRTVKWGSAYRCQKCGYLEIYAK